MSENPIWPRGTRVKKKRKEKWPKAKKTEEKKKKKIIRPKA